MQACVYAALCMLLSSGLVDAPYLCTIECLCSVFWPLLAAAVLPTQVLSISSPVSLSVKYSIIVLTIVF